MISMRRLLCFAGLFFLGGLCHSCGRNSQLARQSPVPMADRSAGNVVSLLLEPRMHVESGKRRVLLDLTVRNLTDKVVRIYPSQVHSTCEVWGSVTIRTLGGPTVRYVGAKELSIARSGTFEDLGPRQTLRIRDVDLTDFYDFPVEAATLSFDFQGFVVTLDDGSSPWVEAGPAVLAYLPADRDQSGRMRFPPGRGIAEKLSTADGVVIRCRL